MTQDVKGNLFDTREVYNEVDDTSLKKTLQKSHTSVPITVENLGSSRQSNNLFKLSTKE